MAGPVLVTYATRSGSTQEVAEAVASTLREHGLEVEIHPVKSVRSLSGYRAVVLGHRSICSAGTRTPSGCCRGGAKLCKPSRRRFSP